MSAVVDPEDVERARAALNTMIVPEQFKEFTDDDFRKLSAEGYKSVQSLQSASTTGLRAAGLMFAKVDYIIKAQGAAAGPGPGSAAAAAFRQVVREEFRAYHEERASRSRMAHSFSSVGSTAAEGNLRHLDIMEMKGNKVESRALVLPDGTPECGAFDWGPYDSENAGLQPLLSHHQEQLGRLGVVFGLEGFEMYDVHNSTNMKIQIDSREYKGIYDGCLAPYGLAPASAISQCRVAYEHKKPAMAAQVAQGQAPAVTYTGRNKGQAVTEALAAYAYASGPVLLDLTDGTTHHILEFRKKKLIVWEDLTPTQAYYLQDKHLKSLPSFTEPTLSLKDIPEEQQELMQSFHQLRPSSALEEQLESIVPFLQDPEERLQTAFQLIHASWQSQSDEVQMQLPAVIQNFYC